MQGVKYLGMDTETTGLDPHSSKVRLIQIALTEDVVYVIDLFKVSLDNFLICFKRLIKLFKQYRIVVIFQNFKFDLQMFWSIGIDFYRVNVFDTMLAAQMLEAGLDVEYNLEALCARYLSQKIDKTEQKSDWSKDLTREQITYAVTDVIVLLNLYVVLNRKLKKETNNGTSLEEVFNLEMKVIFPLASMEYYGLKLDTDKLLNHAKPEYEAIKEQAEKTFLELMPTRYPRYNLLGELVDKGIEISSSNQVLKVLQEIGIPNPNPDINAKLIQSTGKEAVGLVDLVEYPIVYALLDFRGASKLLNGYINALPNKINSITNRIHAYYRQSINTGRVAMFDPNLQQIPRPKPNQQHTIRSAFIPEYEYVYAKTDFSQVEIRVIAEVIYTSTGCDVMLKEFLENKDPYISTAALISGISYEECLALPDKERKSKRQAAKALRLGLNYGLGYRKFSRYAKLQYNVEMTVKQAKYNIEMYFKAYPGLKQYQDSFTNKGIMEAYTMPPYNRRRLWELKASPGALVNQRVQGTSADITKVAMVYMFEYLYDQGYYPVANQDVKLVLQVHDELVLEVKEPLAEQYLNKLNECMIKAGELVIKNCPILVEGKIAKSLAEK
jgi:DNA polymerase I-like protein with 3'-5' exonuclease and polymerase domains